MTDHEKAADGVSSTMAAQESKRAPILEPHTIDRKTFEVLRARFARRRYVLQRVFRADDGRVTYHVARNTQTRIFSHPHDVAGFLAVVEGQPV
jgi:hypothetical protein